MANYYYTRVRLMVSASSDFQNALNPDVGAVTSYNPVTVYNKYYAWYIVDVYKTQDPDFDHWRTTSPLSGSILPDSKRRITNIVSNTSNANVKVGSVIHENSHLYFSVSHSSGVDSGTISCAPTFTVYQTDSGPNEVEVTNIWWPTPNNDPLTLGFTTKVTDPTFPKDNIHKIMEAKVPGFSISNYFWDKCLGKWAVIIHSHSGLNTLHYFDKNGTTDTVPIPGGKFADSKGVIKKIKEWNTANFNKFMESKTGLTCGTNDGSSAVGDPKTIPSADMRWNPPPHKYSRDISLGERINNRKLTANQAKVAAAFSGLPMERGRIFQDAAGAAILNKNPDKLKTVTSLTGPKQWGFRFMYNPQTISYSTASNNSVDWTLGSSDPATLLAGNSNVTFDIYINRIVDMTYLADVKLGKSGQSQQSMYTRNLDPVEIDGILNRGTEYDIEFLYRVLNGDPLKNPLLFNPAYKGETADFGYTTGVPCWLYLNENLRYYGSVASFNVNHVMFDLHMVPMLSVVSITFSRYPALWTDTAIAVSAGGQQGAITAVKGYIASTGTSGGATTKP
jgi:hypothetical protein